MRIYLVGMGLIVAFLSGCSSLTDSTDDSLSLSSEAVSSGSAGEGSGTEETESAAEASPDLDPFAAVWAEFLRAFDRALVSDTLPSELEDLATADAIAWAQAEQTANRSLVAEGAFDGIVEIESTIQAASTVGDGSNQLTDCTAQRITSVEGDTFEVWAEHTVEFTETPDGIRIASVAVTQDGWTSSEDGEYGCAPDSFLAEAERVAELFISGANQFQADPRGDVPDDLTEAMGTHSMIEIMREQMIEEGAYLEGRYEASVDALGIDLNYSFSDGPVVIVDACVRYPDGLEVKSLDTDEVIEEAVPAGEAQHVYVLVTIRRAESDRGRAFASVPATAAC